MTRSENFILDFTHIYIDENIEQTENIVRIDCSDILETDLYCTKKGEAEIQKRIENFSINGVHFIDSGNYHYITKIMTDKINKKFSLVLYDHHTDMQKPMVEGMTSCGDWAAQVIEQNENLEQLILVGASEVDIQQINVKNQSKLITFSAEELRNDSGREKLDLIETDVPFYISIDKDILDKHYIETNWSQGHMSLGMLEHLLKFFLNQLVKLLGHFVKAVVERNELNQIWTINSNIKMAIAQFDKGGRQIVNRFFDDSKGCKSK